MADLTKAGDGAPPADSSSANAAPGITPPDGDTSVAGDHGAPKHRYPPIPYGRFNTVVRENQRLREENERLRADDEKRAGERPSTREPAPAFEDDPTAHLRHANEQLQRRIDKMEAKQSAADRRAETEALEQRLFAAMEKYDIFKSPTLNVMMQEHAWMTMTQDEKAIPEDIVASFAEEFSKEGWKPPRTINPERERLYGRDGTEPRSGPRTTPVLSDEERRKIVSSKLSPKGIADTLFRRNRERHAADDQEARRRMP